MWGNWAKDSIVWGNSIVWGVPHIRIARVHRVGRVSVELHRVGKFSGRRRRPVNP